MGNDVRVVGAVIVEDGRVLCVQRGPHGALAGMWEFPGGKIEDGEDPREALSREIREELDCEIDIGDEVTTTRHKYAFAVVTLTTFWCRITDGLPRLIEHAAQAWLHPSDLATLDWAPADIPAVDLIRLSNCR
ncbi:(deoxy)nucleoside triphosphate pyrophosphohydrolase [Janibacter sp. YIM B02568]|uniref:(deoxy)nucleoside triphosphate pyrophosphohydrolase n=1 Tax=Janibacter endophyticus TaxID=2806261 RepID=UPI00194F0CF0|nr:(deoxy)nucleoside triphosphate pyrophosphohydrolase [Janibacter endophyticus]MBM6545029.1 (deoxy)nucleoside triphosphate pyrophosphohydrolase [Janibacter endophyticus]